MMYNEEFKREISVECIFQSSKVFENGGPFKDLLSKSSLEAKRDERLKASGELKYFECTDKRWDLEPKTMFYDYIYIKALEENKELASKLLEYDCFTDIEFNNKKSINCQARSAAMFVSLKKQNLLNSAIDNIESFKKLYRKDIDEVQLSLFDLNK